MKRILEQYYLMEELKDCPVVKVKEEEGGCPECYKLSKNTHEELEELGPNGRTPFGRFTCHNCNYSCIYWDAH